MRQEEREMVGELWGEIWGWSIRGGAGFRGAKPVDWTTDPRWRERSVRRQYVLDKG